MVFLRHGWRFYCFVASRLPDGVCDLWFGVLAGVLARGLGCIDRVCFVTWI